MGYEITFAGAFVFDRPVKPEHGNYLRQFCQTRRMRRNPLVAMTQPDPIRIAAGLPIGAEGGYYVGGIPGAAWGNMPDPSVTAADTPPMGQPSSWCSWTVTDANTCLVWDGLDTQFILYEEWLQFIIKRFLERWRYTITGEVHFEGDDADDRGRLLVTNNVIRAQHARTETVYVDDETQVFPALPLPPSKRFLELE